MLPPKRTRSVDARRRLIEEARSVSVLDHPAIQTVYDAGETDDGGVYIAFALYEGPTLRQRIEAEGPLTPVDAARIAMAMAQGLEAAHARGIVHRDVKPSNVIVFGDGRVKILDFGVATRAGDAEDGPSFGTIAYMSPEQTRGGPVDARTDVWALGVVLSEMVTGERPFRGDDDSALIRAIREAEPTRPDRVDAVPPVLAAVIDRCLRKDPDARYADMGALAADLAGFLGTRGPARRASIATGVAAAAVLVAGAAFVLTRGAGPGDAGGGRVLPAASAMTILPFVAVSDDTVLTRLGRQLAVTVSASLDGVGEIHTTEAVAVLSALDGDGAAIEARALAERFASSSYLVGTILESGSGTVRVDGVIHDTPSGEEIARLSASGARTDIAALTDSVALALVRAVWREGDVPTPSIAGVTTRSLPALRAYLDGELLLAGGEFERAVEAFDAAFRADSTFWFALYRSRYPRTYEGTRPLDSELADRLYRNRGALPEPDRLLLEASRAPSVRERIALRRDIVRRFPAYVPGGWSYANALVHTGPYSGVPLEEARRALERTLALDPEFFPAWEHLLWVTVIQRDRERANEALRRLEAAERRGNRRMLVELGPTYRALVAGLDGGMNADDVDRKVTAVLEYRGPLAPFFSLDLLVYGDPVGQSAVGREVLRRGAPQNLDDVYLAGLAASLAARGDWRSALQSASATDGARMGQRLLPYGVGAVGAWLDELSSAEATDARRAVVPSAEPLRPEERAELAWLDGLVAFAEADRASLDAARERLVGSEGRFTEDLAGSLDAFATALDGDSASAGRRLAALEWNALDRFAPRGRSHPWVAGVNRLASARWLAADGDTAQALRLLGWEEATLPESSRGLWPLGIALSPHASLLRARLYDGLGDAERAAFHYGTVLRRYDLAEGPGAARLREARAFLERLDR